MWEKTLALISAIIDLQLGVQRQWMYLESIVSKDVLELALCVSLLHARLHQFMAHRKISRKMLPAEAKLCPLLQCNVRRPHQIALNLFSLVCS